MLLFKRKRILRGDKDSISEKYESEIQGVVNFYIRKGL